ncbi:MAG: hypothetical protein HYR96_04170 [Deltaproteobacteria bacterium]|nr:hypothetical protein [Deltaproteobacteria bacterium]MBI3295529.1 hypothetical protein [Deltaproteobacteria bacterium]
MQRVVLIAVGFLAVPLFAKTYECQVSREDFIDLIDKTHIVQTQLGAFTFDSDNKKPTPFFVINTNIEKAAIFCLGNSGCTGGPATWVSCSYFGDSSSTQAALDQLEAGGCLERWYRIRPVNSASADVGANHIALEALHDSRAAYVVACRAKG